MKLRFRSGVEIEGTPEEIWVIVLKLNKYSVYDKIG